MATIPRSAESLTDDDRVVVVGAGLAGLRTVERLRRLQYSGRITLVGAEDRLPYDRPPLSKQLLVADEEPATPVPLRPAARMPALDAELRLGSTAQRLDLDRRQITLNDGTILEWDRLVIATGVRPRPVAEWADLNAVTSLRTFVDCLRLRQALLPGSRLVVVGGGVLGCEVAASAHSRGVEVELVEQLDQPMLRAVGSQLGAFLAQHHQVRGVRLHLGTSVRNIEETSDGLRVNLTSGITIRADHVLAAIGSVPNTEWLEGSGLALDDGVVCDYSGAASVEGVFAVGDVARMPHGRYGERRLEHWTNATDTAHHVAANLVAAPGERTALSEVPYFWTDQYGLKLQVYGLPGSSDELRIVEGALASNEFVALHVGDDIVTGISGVGRPAALVRSRCLLERVTPVEEAVAAAPWVPPRSG